MCADCFVVGLGYRPRIRRGHHTPASLAIFAVAIFKIRLVGLYFMELKMAPRVLRGIFEGYCVGLLGLLTAMFVFA